MFENRVNLIYAIVILTDRSSDITIHLFRIVSLQFPCSLIHAIFYISPSLGPTCKAAYSHIAHFVPIRHHLLSTSLTSRPHMSYPSSPIHSSPCVLLDSLSHCHCRTTASLYVVAGKPSSSSSAQTSRSASKSRLPTGTARAALLNAMAASAGAPDLAHHTSI